MRNDLLLMSAFEEVLPDGVYKLVCENVTDTGDGYNSGTDFIGMKYDPPVGKITPEYHSGLRIIQVGDRYGKEADGNYITFCLEDATVPGTTATLTRLDTGKTVTMRCASVGTAKYPEYMGPVEADGSHFILKTDKVVYFTAVISS